MFRMCSSNVERDIANVEVVGSSPICCSRFRFKSKSNAVTRLLHLPIFVYLCIMECLKKIPRPERRRFLALCRKNNVLTKDEIAKKIEWNLSHGFERHSMLHNLEQLEEIHAVIEVIGEDGLEVWREARQTVIDYKADYCATPVRVRQDNKRESNWGNGCVWRGKDRRPSKKRGLATWRRYLSRDGKVLVSNAEAKAVRDRDVATQNAQFGWRVKRHTSKRMWHKAHEERYRESIAQETNIGTGS